MAKRTQPAFVSAGKVRSENAISHDHHSFGLVQHGSPFLTTDDLPSTLLHTIATTRLDPA